MPFCRLGEVTGPESNGDRASPRLTVRGLDGSIVIDAGSAELKAAWQEPLLLVVSWGRRRPAMVDPGRAIGLCHLSIESYDQMKMRV